MPHPRQPPRPGAYKFIFDITMCEHYTFHLKTGTQQRTVTESELEQFARFIGLDRVAPDRFSWLFVMSILFHSEVNGIDPTVIIDEIRNLEGGDAEVGTKPATQFNRAPLIGYWHKHFFSAHFVAKNILNQLAGGALKALIKDVLDPNKSSVVTEEMINVLTHRAITETLENRETENKLTGEWIVFAKHAGQNYYLTIALHKTGDQAIYDQIKTVFRQFPFLNAAN